MIQRAARPSPPVYDHPRHLPGWHATPALPNGDRREQELLTKAARALPPPDPIGALDAGAPPAYSELVRTLIEYEREHDRAEAAMFELELARAWLIRDIFDLYAPLIEASVHEGLQEGTLEPDVGARVLAWLRNEQVEAGRTITALYTARRRWLVRRTWLIPGDKDVIAALCANPGDKDCGPMTEAELIEIENRAALASPGPWDAYQPSEFPEDWRIAAVGLSHERGYICRLTTSHDPRQSGGAGGALLPPRREDAEFMAHARADVPALVAEVRRLRALAGER